MSMRPRNAAQVKMTSERMYQIIRYPVVTEKSTLGSQYGQVTFVVDLYATKPEIKVAVELFSIEKFGQLTLCVRRVK